MAQDQLHDEEAVLHYQYFRNAQNSPGYSILCYDGGYSKLRLHGTEFLLDNLGKVLTRKIPDFEDGGQHSFGKEKLEDLLQILESNNFRSLTDEYQSYIPESWAEMTTLDGYTSSTTQSLAVRSPSDGLTHKVTKVNMPFPEYVRKVIDILIGPYQSKIKATAFVF